MCVEWDKLKATSINVFTVIESLSWCRGGMLPKRLSVSASATLMYQFTRVTQIFSNRIFETKWAINRSQTRQ